MSAAIWQSRHIQRWLSSLTRRKNSLSLILCSSLLLLLARYYCCSGVVSPGSTYRATKPISQYRVLSSTPAMRMVSQWPLHVVKWKEEELFSIELPIKSLIIVDSIVFLRLEILLYIFCVFFSVVTGIINAMYEIIKGRCFCGNLMSYPRPLDATNFIWYKLFGSTVSPYSEACVWTRLFLCEKPLSVLSHPFTRHSL